MQNIKFGSVVVLHNDDYLCKLEDGKSCLVYFEDGNINVLTASSFEYLLEQYNNIFLENYNGGK